MFNYPGAVSLICGWSSGDVVALGNSTVLRLRKIATAVKKIVTTEQDGQKSVRRMDNLKKIVDILVT
jgi:hypothetical protein